MVKNIPFEIQVEIMKWLPVISLIQFRSVSKAWRSLIDSPEFIANSFCHTGPQHLLVRYCKPLEMEYSYVSFVDDEAFPLQKFALTIPMTGKLLNFVGSSHGLLCFYGTYSEKPGQSYHLYKSDAVLWNPSIRKSISIAMLHKQWSVVVDQEIAGFGVCPVTIDPKIVMMTKRHSRWLVDMAKPLWEIMVYSLNSGKWRNLPSNLLSNSISVIGYQVVIDGFIYWHAFDRPNLDLWLCSGRHLILSFDITGETYSMLNLPDDMLDQISICKLRESLAVLGVSNDNITCDVWMMDHGDGDQKSFAKLFTVETPSASFSTLGFRNNGEVLMEMTDEVLTDGYWCCRSAGLVCYELDSKRINDLGICTEFLLSSVTPYVESLLLLDQPACVSH